MKKFRTILCLALIALCIPAILRASHTLPADNAALVAEKYAGWSGVLRIWSYEGFTPGDSFTGWLNQCAALFEKSHPGVYVQTRPVSLDVLRTMGQSGVRPPDMLIFPPGALDSSEGLAPLSDPNVREPLKSCGGGRALPIALGGYAWALNTTLLPSLPAAWTPDQYALPADEPHRRWSAAAHHLLQITASMEETEIELPGVDLGLEALAPATSPLDRFTSGALPALPVTQREIARLQRLSDQGRGPDWTIAAGCPYTDQILYLAIPVSDSSDRQSLAEAFAHHLLTDACQSLLADRAAFSPTNAPAQWRANSPYLLIDAALRSPAVQIMPAFPPFES